MVHLIGLVSLTAYPNKIVRGGMSRHPPPPILASPGAGASVVHRRKLEASLRMAPSENNEI